jgi:hypothetical protein
MRERGENRYQQPEVTAIRRKRGAGNPEVKSASTSYSERLNLGIRQHNKKMGRLTNAHAKKLEMLEHSQAIAFAYYSWCRPHETLAGKTPAMAAGLTDRRWAIRDLLALIPAN